MKKKSDLNPKEYDQLQIKKKRKRRFVLLIVEIIVAVLLVGALYYWLQLNRIRTVDQSEFNQDEIKATIDEETQQVLSGYTNIAVFGLDNRQEGVYERGNSDVILVISINNDTKEIRMVSVYRDTYLKIDDDRYRKANAAYANGGAQQAVWMLNNNLDLDIEDYVSVDFWAVADVIDALGGIDIDITYDELLYMNDYIYAMNIEMDLDYEIPYMEEIGLQHMTGPQAVAYSRIRYTSGGDFKRAQRQRLVLTEMINKAKTDMNLKAVNAICQNVFPQIETSMTQQEMLTLIASAFDYELADSRGWPFNKLTSNSSSLGDCEVPCDLVTNVERLHSFLFGEYYYNPSETVETISEYIVDKTGYTAESGYEDEFTEADDFSDGNVINESYEAQGESED